MTQPYRMLQCDATLGEGPLWCSRSQTLYWIDGFDPHLWYWRWDSEKPRSRRLARPPAALAQLPDGRLLLAFRERFAVLGEAEDTPGEIELPGLALGDERFNDAKVDRRGRFWIGTIDRALTRPIGRLYRIDDGGIQAMDEGFALSNGMGWSPDNARMYFAESLDRQIYTYDFDATAGTLQDRRVLASYRGGAPKPDGLTVDAEGGIWCAIFGSSCVVRYLPDGTLDRTIRLPVSCPTSCMLGGPDLRTLFVTSARYSLSEDELRQQPFAGSVFAFQVDVPGIPEPMLAESNALARAAR